MKIDHMKHENGYKSKVIQIKETVFIETESTSRQRAIMARLGTGTQDLNRGRKYNACFALTVKNPTVPDHCNGLTAYPI
jgi:hypothetical protein